MSVASEAPPLPAVTGVTSGRGEGDDSDGRGGARGIDGLTAAERSRLRKAWLGATAPLLVLFSWMLTAGRWDFLQQQYFDNFFDAQTRAIFDGHLDVPPGVVGFEGFVTRGKTYIYFGPFPSFLRMPIMAVTDRFDGRLTTLSILGGTVALIFAAFRLNCMVRRMVRGTDPVGPRETWTTAGLSVAVLAAPPMFLTSSAVVYHEATMWGLAFTVAAYDAVLRWQRDRRAKRLVVISLLLAGGLLSRQTVALGALAALGFTALAHLVRLWRARPTLAPEEVSASASASAFSSEEEEESPPPRVKANAGLRPLVRLALAVGVAALVPLGVSMAFNQAKLGQLFGLPMGRQAYAESMTNRQAVLDENPSYASTSFLGTTAWTYLKPIGLDVREDLPYLDFPRTGPQVVGGDDVQFDVLDWSSSLPTSAPALTVLTVAGVVHTVRSRRRREADERLWPLWVGTLVGSFSVLLFAFVANRYLADIYPVVLIGGLVGFHAAGRASAGWGPWRRRVAMSGLGGLIVVGLAVNLALGLEYQRERGPVVPESYRAEWVGWRLDSPGAPTARTIALDDPFPPVADGGLLAVGDCDGLYIGMRDQWLAVERGPGVGVFDLRVDLDDLPVGDRFPLLSYGATDEQATVVGVVRLDDDTVRVDTLLPAFFETDWDLGQPVDLGGEVTLRVVADPRQRVSNVWHGTRLLNPVNLPPARRPVNPGSTPDRPGVIGEWPAGGVELLDGDTSVCRSATG